ncbi:hypothetical protein ACFYUY_01630 [Kitasatospora sp. NPDC004745]|uniref:hypothetical protein n=1 Tax=Kitasatospora sp. NPDC004745 TaxID=3364019 RepID=UPI0036968D73
MRPSSLPKARDQILRHLTDPAMPLRANTGDSNEAGRQAEVSKLRAAELYWASADMTALAVASGSQLASARWASADRPSPSGLIVFDGGVGNFPMDGVEVPIEAVTWGAVDGELGISIWLTRATLDAEVKRRGRFTRLVIEQIPPLVPVLGRSIPVGADPVPFAALDPDLPTLVMQTLAAAWLLMEQPTLTERQAETADKATARAYGRRQEAVPQVTLIDLRRTYIPGQREETGTDIAGRRYRHRWVVQGHWRDQPYGPERALRRKQWIPAHLKGPDGAPMLATERVNVWRR